MNRITREKAQRRAEILRVARGVDKGIGRPIEELIKSPCDEPVKGVEAQRLRNYATSEFLDPQCDLDAYGRSLVMGDLEHVKEDFQERVQKHKTCGQPEDQARAAAARDLYAMHWGPTKVPIYDLLLLATQLAPNLRFGHLAIARWLTKDANVPVDGLDVSGTTALAHCISTKPAFEPELAQILYDAGANINHRNRYGDVPANEICMVWDPKNLPRAVLALRWFLSHGGNIDILENDGQTCARMLLSSVNQKYQDRTLQRVVQEEDFRRRQRSDVCCAFCGREDKPVMICSRCKKAKYCPPSRNCQRSDWKNHKPSCKA
ncbi:hypothetical protein NEOLEDRAFT_1123652 [Neolentinus lepideus HHB14362 ss-1]|uniref:MYND-type domain-containing protein n=1 Tax=Neolentinus lepideus HHB14362 ss-1 TaxID=1314782 RepID=A0A165NL25_9AGAM|nr:hypothetical protein NEOLEDRAFT_1123652 [Neolentinus lepideus HHB14362 ss-1]